MNRLIALADTTHRLVTWFAKQNQITAKIEYAGNLRGQDLKT